MATGGIISDVWQIEWRGVRWGWPATTVGITDLTGWFDYALRGTNPDRPGRHGTLPGLKRAGERTIEAELTVFDDDLTTLTGIRVATAPAEDPAEEELVIWAGTDAPQWVRARLERRAVPTDHAWSVGHHRATLQWVASDPRRYSTTLTTSPVIGLPTGASGGLPFPVTFPLAFGSGGGLPQATLTNTGDVATWPTFTVTGPVTGPIIANATTGRRLQFNAAFTVAAGQTMTIDTDARSVTVDGVARRDALVIAEWFSLPPGDTVVTFAGQGAYDPAAGLVVQFRNAYL